MDEKTLNDLLECSVCLERLDISSKVLPCQHTFCKKCLEVIVSSRQELRCPECRILVDIKIEDLPSNILLIRILESMKNINQYSNANDFPQSSKDNIGLVHPDIKNTGIVLTDNQSKNQVLKLMSSNRCNLPHAIALYDFIPRESSDLYFNKGDLIILKKKIDMNWLVGELHGREGSFPINYVNVVKSLPSAQCIALYDFKMGPKDEEGCLTFKKGAIINVLRRVDHNWAEGCIGLCIGIFPIAFVEMNDLAKQVLDDTSVNISSSCLVLPRPLPSIPCDNSSTSESSSSVTSPSLSCGSNISTSSSSSGSISNENSHKHYKSDFEDLTEKRYSLNSSSRKINLISSQSNRCSVEFPCNLLSDIVVKATNVRTMSGSKNSQMHSQHHDLIESEGHNIGRTLPWAYVALYPYKPRKADELELKKGGIYFVMERCLDGWYKGKNWADKSGVFPGNYVSLLRNSDHLIASRKLIHNDIVNQLQLSSSQIPLSSRNEEQQSTLLAQSSPPELPPRCNTILTNSVLTTSFNQHMESIFNRKLNTLQQQRNENTKSRSESVRDVTDKISNFHMVQEQPFNVSNSAVPVLAQQSTKKNKGTNSNISLMKHLTNIKRSQSPTQQHVNLKTCPTSEAVNLFIPPTLKYNTILSSQPTHVRSGSCPNQLLQSLPVENGSGNTLSSSKIDFDLSYGSKRSKSYKERSSEQSIRQQANINKTTKYAANAINVNESIVLSDHKLKDRQFPVLLNNSNHNIYQHRKTQSLDANTSLSNSEYENLTKR